MFENPNFSKPEPPNLAIPHCFAKIINLSTDPPSFLWYLRLFSYLIYWRINNKNCGHEEDGWSVITLFPTPIKNPRALITTCLLNEESYDIWAKLMVIFLKVKNKLGFINGGFVNLTVGFSVASKRKHCIHCCRNDHKVS